ncbi:MAG: shikimate dehydrogenase [Actinomycetota bacterium]|nr:shikimate dehydrogenase [Actinomycetota bacterium]
MTDGGSVAGSGSAAGSGSVAREGRRAAVLGHPIAHSLSPALHRAAYAALGLTGWEYTAIDVTEDDLPGFVRGLGPRWAGLSLTMPLKRTVRPLLAAESSLARRVGAVNTVVLGPDGAVGHNTDVPGIVGALREAGIDRLPSGGGVVLGGGATAASALAALREMGCDRPRVLVRSRARAADLLVACERLDISPELMDLQDVVDGRAELGGPEVVVSTLPPGAADRLASGLVRAVSCPGCSPPTAQPTAADPAAGAPVLLDVVYAPWPTALARSWLAGGWTVVGGFEMLLHQAAGQVELMTGRPAPLEGMRAAGEHELARRSTPSP